MSLLLHAITSPPETSEIDVQGLRRERLTRVDVAGLASWSTTLGTPADGTSFAREDLLDHHRVVTEVFVRVEACLPARFPTVLDASRLEALVAERGASLRQQLEVVRGACELAVTAVWTSPEAPPPIPPEAAPGRRYLLERQQRLTVSDRRRRRAAELADALERELGGALLDTRRAICPSATVALSCAFLLPVAAVEAAKQRVPCAAPDVRILLNGPWPPYTFASVRSE